MLLGMKKGNKLQIQKFNSVHYNSVYSYEYVENRNKSIKSLYFKARINVN